MTAVLPKDITQEAYEKSTGREGSLINLKDLLGMRLRALIFAFVGLKAMRSKKTELRRNNVRYLHTGQRNLVQHRTKPAAKEI